MIAQSLSVALGLWLMASPGVLGYGEPGSTVAWIAGPVIASASFIAAFSIGRPLRWVNVPAGLTVSLLTPLLDTPTVGVVNAIAVGLAVVALVLVTPEPDERYAGGWSSLFR